ncbi:RecQ family ATP-dependent DNA helicase [Ureibacillus manganicus]|uniref:ATP-dependent DNA helicase RecQ n=1 Tax=Ureibacillus manganicus DSM 26584 TaxID=1384049 RepID=A0A0A3IXM9_9BACL|nr:ATP-dependent DNA helicase RecQ [Ureibacillus manganicus]KGR79577.1 ATP-dependent DNA helicase [Ureibacillus manganicus DSM 26584]
MELEDILYRHFGYHSFRPGQKEVIEQIVVGRDVIALLPTGMGKSLCYQLPGYVFNGTVLIVSPLLSLMQDQVTQMKQFGEKRVVALNSFLTFQQKQYALNYLHQYRFIFISPEMLLQKQVYERLNEVNLSLVVVDEAHCISQWGFDFRPDYLRIGELFHGVNRPPILALSATATNKVLGDIQNYLKMDEPFHYIHSVDRKNIHLSRRQFQRQEDKVDWIIEHVLETEGPGIIYTQSRTKAENISNRLIQVGVQAASYHAGKESVDRQFIQQQFIEGSIQWIVATNAFGMGVHKSDVRQVIHHSLPSNIANYMQEIGRAGRDGKDSLAILLYEDGDENFAKMLATDDLPTDHHIALYENYRFKNENPFIMFQNGEISETAFRVLDYWMNEQPTDEVQRLLHKMRIEKMQAVDEMMEIVQTKDCMRNVLVHYFGQQLTERPNNCCECCGIIVKEIIEPRKLHEISTKPDSWKDRIQSILIGRKNK